MNSGKWLLSIVAIIAVGGIGFAGFELGKRKAVVGANANIPSNASSESSSTDKTSVGSEPVATVQVATIREDQIS